MLLYQKSPVHAILGAHGGDRQTHITQMDITSYRLNWRRGRFIGKVGKENVIFKVLFWKQDGVAPLVTDPPCANSTPCQNKPPCHPSALHWSMFRAINKIKYKKKLFRIFYLGVIFCESFSLLALPIRSCKCFKDSGGRPPLNDLTFNEKQCL